jgi:acyl dehydratase
MSIVVDSPAALADAVGSTATGDWFAIDQQRIQAFADATEDWQWIHLDADRAASGPFSATIAHGYLTLSLVPRLMFELLEIASGQTLNYGIEKVRFPAPVPVGSRIRLALTVATVEEVAGGFQVGFQTVVECDAAAKPACVALVVYRFLR